MKVLFLGSSDFSLPTLKLFTEKSLISGVVTRAPKKRGRGLLEESTPVGKEAKRLGLTLYELDSLKELKDEALEDVNILVSAAFGLFIPPSVFNRPPMGGINLHPSLLPLYRGPVPIERALMAGELLTGVSIHYLVKGIDEGDILAQEEIAIGEEENYGELSHRLSIIGANLLLKTVEGLFRGEIIPRPQDHLKATYYPFLKREERVINWGREGKSIFNLIRALSPKPGALTYHEGEEWKIFKVRVLDETNNDMDISILEDKPDGSFIISRDSLLVKSKKCVLEILLLQRPGREPQPASSFVKGFRLKKGRLYSSVK